jgi:hypothetical protein
MMESTKRQLAAALPRLSALALQSGYAAGVGSDGLRPA